jgi:hypothetical protein
MRAISPSCSATVRSRFRLGAAGGIAAAFLVRHLTDHQRAAFDLLADQRELLRPLRLSSLARRPHRGTTPRPIGVPDPRQRWRDIDLLPGRRGEGSEREIRCVGEENLTGGNTARLITVAPDGGSRFRSAKWHGQMTGSPSS